MRKKWDVLELNELLLPDHSDAAVSADDEVQKSECKRTETYAQRSVQ